MLWIYGGGFTGGSGGQAWYDGEDLAAKGAVIVTMNYRLGWFGFFAHPELAKEAGNSGSGNYGMMDAIAALKWMKGNISAFGGDPNNVTIAGEVGRRHHGRRARRIAAGEGAVPPRDPRERRVDGAEDGPHDDDGAGAGQRREGAGGCRYQNDRRAERETVCRATEHRRSPAGHRRLSDPRGPLEHVYEWPAERRRYARRIQQGRNTFGGGGGGPGRGGAAPRHRRRRSNGYVARGKTSTASWRTSS